MRVAAWLGRVLDGTKPVAGVSIYVFQTDADGRYEYSTIRPGHYDNNAAHVHYVVRARGYKPLLLDLWFDDDPKLLARRPEGRPEIPVSFPQNVLAIRPVTREADGTWHATRDIEMVRE